MVFYLKIQSFEVTQNTNHIVGWLVFNSTFSTKRLYQCHAKVQGDHSPDNVKFPDDSLMVHGIPPRHSAC